jgi:hypothetical protein
MSLRRFAPLSFFIACFLVNGHVAAQAPRCVSIKGVLLAKKGEFLWEALKADAAAPTERMLVSLFESDLHSGNSAVEVRLRGDIGEVGPLPAFESAIHIHDNPKVDLELTLDRGIIVLVNKKKEGPAHVNVRIRGKTLHVTLGEPDAALGIDLYSRHAPGLAALKADHPTFFVFMLNLKGNVHISHNDKSVALSAPPGPAMLRWNSEFPELDAQHLDKLPDWVTPSPAEKKSFEEINRIAKSIGANFPHFAFLRMVVSNDPLERKVGLAAVGALGTPAPLFAALQKSQHADARQFSIIVVRNWLGQGPGQIKKLEAALSGFGLSKTDIESLLHLFLGFDDEERQHPATYQVLVEGLGHSKLLVRELSYWHLVRMAPAGKSITYDPAGTQEQMQAGVRQWRELIPAGKLPPGTNK